MARKKPLPPLESLRGFHHQAEEIDAYHQWRRPQVPLPLVLSEAFGRHKTAAALLKQILYWSVDDDGRTKLGVTYKGAYWLVKTEAEMAAEIGCSERSVTNAKKVLKGMGVVAIENHRQPYYNGAPVTHYQIQFAALLRVFGPATIAHAVKVAQLSQSAHKTPSILDVAASLDAWNVIRDYSETIPVDEDLVEAWTETFSTFLRRAEHAYQPGHPDAPERAMAIEGVRDGLGLLAGHAGIPSNLRSPFRNECGINTATTPKILVGVHLPDGEPDGGPGRDAVPVSQVGGGHVASRAAIGIDQVSRGTGSSTSSSDGTDVDPVIEGTLSSPGSSDGASVGHDQVRLVTGTGRPIDASPAGQLTDPDQAGPSRGSSPGGRARGSTDLPGVDLEGAHEALRDSFGSSLEHTLKQAPRRYVEDSDEAFKERQSTHEKGIRGRVYEAVRGCGGVSAARLSADKVRRPLEKLAERKGLPEAARHFVESAASACGRVEGDDMANALVLFQTGFPVTLAKISDPFEEQGLRNALVARYDRVTTKSLVQVVAECCQVEPGCLYRTLNTLIKKTTDSTDRWDRTPFVDALADAALGGRELGVFFHRLIHHLPDGLRENVGGLLDWISEMDDLDPTIDEALRGFVMRRGASARRPAITQ